MSEEITILLLGGSSFLGLQTAETLFYFYDVYCSYNKSFAPRFFPEFNWFQLDFLVNDTKLLKKQLAKLIEKTGAKYVINFAGISSPLESKLHYEQSTMINELANGVIANICAEKDSIPIFISSDHVFSGKSGPFAEDEEPNPLKNSVYGNQKFHAEQFYKQLEKYAILRVSTTIGSNFHFQKQNIYVKTLGNLKEKKIVYGAPNKIRTASHCYNVAFMINKIIEAFDQERITKGLFHLPGELISEYELLKKIAFVNRCEPELVQARAITDDNQSYPLSLGLHSDKTRSILKGRYLTLDEGLNQLVVEDQ